MADSDSSAGWLTTSHRGYLSLVTGDLWDVMEKSLLWQQFFQAF
jgi:hypothetical protein